MAESTGNAGTPIPVESPFKKPRKPRKPKEKLPPWLAWLRSIGLLSVVGGVIGVIPPQYFWYAVALFHLGLTLIALDVYFEPILPRKFKVFIWLIVTAGFFCFNRWVVFTSAPLGVSAAVINIDYSTGVAPSPGGIQWSPVYTEVNFYVSNPTSSNYTDVDLFVKPDVPVAAIGQVSNLSDVSFEDLYAYSNWLTLDGVGIPWVLYATDAGYKVHCGRIPPNVSLRFVMAVVHLKHSDAAHPAQPTGTPWPSSTPFEEGLFSAVLTADKSGKIYYWYGLAKNLSKFGTKTTPQTIAVSGHYTTGNRRRSVDLVVIPQR